MGKAKIMNTFPDFFPYFISLIIVLNLWSFYDHYRFTRFEGNLKRGLMIWTDPLSWEIRQLLDSLPPSLKVDQSFIRKENNEVLIVENLPSQKYFSFQRQSYFPYIAYVDLSVPESRIEFRTSFSTFPLLIIVLISFFIFFPNFPSGVFPIASPGFWILLVVFLFIFIGSFIWEFYRVRQRLLKFLDQVMSQQRSGSNIGS
jgi:hypothetical protein